MVCACVYCTIDFFSCDIYQCLGIDSLFCLFLFVLVLIVVASMIRGP